MRKYYIVGNRVFNTFCDATEYCEACDFDGEAMITEVNDGERFGKYDKTNNLNIGYVRSDVNLKTIYTIEYITNKRDFERAYDGRHPAPWELYEKITTEDLQQAMTIFIMHYASPRTYDVKLFEDIRLNGETIREQCISDIKNFAAIVEMTGEHLRDIIHAREDTIEMQSVMVDEAQIFKDVFGKDQYEKFISEQKAKRTV